VAAAATGGQARPARQQQRRAGGRGDDGQQGRVVAAALVAAIGDGPQLCHPVAERGLTRGRRDAGGKLLDRFGDRRAGGTHRSEQHEHERQGEQLP